jgi:hypothetical protein
MQTKHKLAIKQNHAEMNAQGLANVLWAISNLKLQCGSQIEHHLCISVIRVGGGFQTASCTS